MKAHRYHLVPITKPPRRYKCPDPDCQGYPKGHRHGRTCNTLDHLPAGWKPGMVLGCLIQSLQRLEVTRRHARRLGYDTTADDLDASIWRLKSTIAAFKASAFATRDKP